MASKSLIKMYEDYSHYKKRRVESDILSGQGTRGWVMVSHPRELEKVIEMKITLGTGNECSITTDRKKTQYPIRWNRLKCDPSQV